MKFRTPRVKNQRMLRAMNEAQKTCAMISDETSISAVTISKILNDRVVPHPATAFSIAATLNVEVSDIFDEVYRGGL